MKCWKRLLNSQICRESMPKKEKEVWAFFTSMETARSMAGLYEKPTEKF
ncbi:MAG: hypothetical protein HFI13_13915 [Lachnospiraceae bacterium]|nr:hypothetical protein [Lachnospiraceae bacterium]